MSTPRKPLEPGIKIKFDGPCGDNLMHVDKIAELVSVHGSGRFLEVEFCVGLQKYRGHIARRQVTHIIKPRKKPAAERVERLEVWLPNDSLKNLFSPGYCYYDEMTVFRDNRRGHTKFVSLLPGEIPVSREALEKAFWEGKRAANNTVNPGDTPSPCDVLSEIAKALGLKESND